MSVLFDPIRVGPIEAKNRFVRSATFECLGDGEGGVTDEAVELYRTLGRGGAGTIVTGIMYVRPDGKGAPRSLGIHHDGLLPGLRRLAEAMKVGGGRAFFQLHHAGGQTLKAFTGERPVGPSAGRRDPMSNEKPRPLAPAEIAGVVADFAAAAARAKEAGADGVQIHAAHGYLVSEFLSPFFNDRADAYGGSQDGRYRILGETVAAVRAAVGPDLSVWVKMNVDDGTPEPGMTPDLAAIYAGRLAADGIDCLEVSAGSTTWAPFVMSRGDACVDDVVRVVPWIARPLIKRRVRASRQPPLVEGYNSEGAAQVKAALGGVPLAVVGGWRTRAAMEACVGSGTADLVSLSRPLVREPGLIKRLETDPTAESTCISCNRCLAAIYNGLPVRCYVKGLPRGGGSRVRAGAPIAG